MRRLFKNNVNLKYPDFTSRADVCAHFNKAHNINRLGELSKLEFEYLQTVPTDLKDHLVMRLGFTPRKLDAFTVDRQQVNIATRMASKWLSEQDVELNSEITLGLVAAAFREVKQSSTLLEGAASDTELDRFQVSHVLPIGGDNGFRYLLLFLARIRFYMIIFTGLVHIFGLGEFVSSGFAWAGFEPGIWKKSTIWQDLIITYFIPGHYGRAISIGINILTAIWLKAPKITNTDYASLNGASRTR